MAARALQPLPMSYQDYILTFSYYAKSISLKREVLMKMLLASPSVSLANQKRIHAFPVLASWWKTPLLPNWQISQRATRTESWLCAFQSQSPNMLHLSTPTHLHYKQQLKRKMHSSDLRKFLLDVPKHDKAISMRDRKRCRLVERCDRETWCGKLQWHRYASHGVLHKAGTVYICITNIIFQQMNSHKTTWMRPNCKLWYLIDYVVLRQKDVSDLFHTRVLSSAEC